jgi:hypothetical protein
LCVSFVCSELVLLIKEGKLVLVDLPACSAEAPFVPSYMPSVSAPFTF